MMFSCPACGFSCKHEHYVCPKCGHKVSERAEEVVITEEMPDELVFIRGGVSSSSSGIVEEDIELIKRKRDFRTIRREIGIDRFREALEVLYMRWGSIDRVAKDVGVTYSAVVRWFRRLDVPHDLHPPRTITVEAIGWRRIPEVAYVIPRLYFERAPFTEQIWACGLNEGEGSHSIGFHRRERVYKPVFSLHMYEAKPVERFARLFGLKVYSRYIDEAEGTVKEYCVITTGTPAISITDYLLKVKYMTTLCKRELQAKRLIMLFKDKWVLTEEEFEEALKRVELE